MNLILQLTDEQAEKLAADLLSKQASKPEPAKPARREFILFNDGLWNHIGEPSPFERTTRAREVLPGDPTPEQVEELVKALKSACKYPTCGNWYEDAMKALAPFRKD